jgi:hypothetical protein
MTGSTGLLYLTVIVSLAIAWGGHAFFTLSRGVERKQRWFPYYIHAVALLFLLILVFSGSWWAVTLVAPFVVLVDQMLIRQARFCPECEAYHPARGWGGAARRCRKCGHVLGPEHGAGVPAPV